MEALLFLLAVALVLLPFVLLAWSFKERRERMERDDALASELGRLQARLHDLERRLVPGAVAAQPAPPPAPAAQPAPPPAPAAQPAAPPASPARAAVPPSPPTLPAATPPASAAPPVPPRPVPSTPSPSPSPARAPAPPRRPRLDVKIDWERFVGVKLYSWLAGIAVVIAAVSFLRYSIDHGWLGAPVRMAIGLVTGVLLVVGCETKRARRYAPTAQALAAGGVATLFSTFYAAHALWHLLPSLATFALLALVAAVAVVLSIRRNAIFIALLGLLGGFATPALLSTGEDRPIALFSYLLVLNVGLAWVAHRKRWPLLSALSLGFTALYQLGWVASFLDETKLPIAIGIFVVFPVLGFASLGLARRRGGEEPPLLTWTAALGAVPPVLFVAWFAVSGSYGAHWALLLGLLALVAAGLAAVAAWQGPTWLHALGGATTLATVAGFLARSWTSEAWPWALALLALLVAVYLGAPLLLAWLGKDFRDDLGRRTVYAAPALLFAFPVIAWIEPGAGSPAPFFPALFLLAAACAAFAVARGDAPVHFVAAGMAIAAEAVWSARSLEPGRLLPALLVYAAFGLLFLGVPLAAERLRRPLRPAGSASALLVLSLGLLFFVAAGPVAATVGGLAGLATLAGLLEAGLLFEASRGRSPLLAPLALVGVGLGFAALAVWWATALVAALLLPAVVAAGGLALVALAGTLWARARAGEERARGLLDEGAFLGLVAHGFMLAVVSRRDLALPAWPWLSVIGVLDLAFLVAALHRRRGELLLGAVGGSAAVLLVFELAFGGRAPAGSIATFAALALAAMAVTGFLLARRLAATGALPRFALAAAAALVAGQALVALGCSGGDASLPVVAGAQAILLGGLLFVAWRAGDQRIALVAAVTASIAAVAFRLSPQGEPGAVLWVATPLYLMLLAYPLLLGARGRAELFPWIGSVVGSGAWFFLAREAVAALGGGPFIGAVPVGQAILLVPHIVVLARAPAPSELDRGRLALMAAAVLAFVTVAIPLQLEKQWITVGWALQAGAVAWLHRRLRHRGLLAWCAALFAAVFVRLALNPSVLVYHAKSATPVLNWYLYTYLVSAAAFFAGAALLARADDRLAPGTPRVSKVLPALGTVLLFLLLNIEIADFFSTGSRIEFRFSAGLAQDLTYTIGWALFAIALLVAGVVLATRTARFAAIGLLAGTVLKAFLHDLARLEGLYRVASFVGLAVSLALVAVVLQRFVLRAAPEPGAAEPRPSPEP